MTRQMTAREILGTGVALMVDNPTLQTAANRTNLCIAARLKWEQEEMGGLAHVQFAYRNGTPIVPPGHCGHPVELVSRGYVDGKGWPKETDPLKGRIFVSRWQTGTHFYAKLDGEDVTGPDGREKWDTWDEAYEAARQCDILRKAAAAPLD